MSQRNPFTYPAPITLDALDDFLAFHRATFGGYRMEEGGDGGSGGDEGSGVGDAGEKFTPISSQEDLNRIIGERLSREKAKYADYQDLQRKAAEFDKASEAAKSEAEKAIDAARTEGEKSATERANARIVRAEAKTLAATAKFRDPADAVAFLDLSKVTVGDDGEPDAAAIKSALDDLAKSKPYLIDDGKGGPKPDPSQGGSGGSQKSGLERGRELHASQRPRSKTS